MKRFFAVVLMIALVILLTPMQEARALTVDWDGFISAINDGFSAEDALPRITINYTQSESAEYDVGGFFAENITVESVVEADCEHGAVTNYTIEIWWFKSQPLTTGSTGKTASYRYTGDPLGHSMTAHPAVVATCTTAGNSAYWYCNNCHKYFSDANGGTEIAENSWVIAALDHDIIHHDAKAPTCTEVGWDAYDTCSRCNYSTYAEKPASHTLVATAAKAATETADGNSAYWTCSVCGKYFSDAAGTKEVQKDSWILKATGHTHTIVTDPEVPATCTKAGLTEGQHCSECNEVIVEQKVIPELGHIWVYYRPDGNGTHTMWCARNCHAYKRADCTKIPLPLDDAEVSICPVCGDCEGADGVTRIRGIKVTENAPAGNLRSFLVAVGDAEYLTLVFENNGELIQPEGAVSLLLIDELKDSSFALLGADGTETPLEADPEQPDTLTLDFAPEDQDPVQVMVLKKN